MMPNLLAALLLIAPVLASDAEPYRFASVTQALAGGRIDWTELRLEISARSDRTMGAWKDRRLQEQDALDGLAPRVLALAERVAVTPERDAAGLMSEEGDLARRLGNSVSAWQIEETRYFSGGGVEMDAVLDLRLWLRPALVSLAAPGQAPAVQEGSTGLVVDARGLPFEASLAPTLLGADGAVLMRAQDLTEEAARSVGAVLYVTDPADPRAAERAGSAPVFSQAASVRDGALVLAPASAASLDAALPRLVASGRVVIVMDSH